MNFLYCDALQDVKTACRESCEKLPLVIKSSTGRVGALHFLPLASRPLASPDCPLASERALKPESVDSSPI